LGKSSSKSRDRWKLKVFQRIHLSDIMLGADGQHIPEKI
jgi:hypothetical protein